MLAAGEINWRGGSRVTNKFAVIFVAWGKKFVNEVQDCIDQSPFLENCDKYLVTDDVTAVTDDRLKVLRTHFKYEGFLRKLEFIDLLPEGYDFYLFLDSDTRIIEDISLGFEKAMKYGIAVAPAPHYSLDQFWGFERIMKKEGVPCRGQMQFNCGVIFFSLNDDVRAVFNRWKVLADKYQQECVHDQPLLSLAMEQEGFNPYCLSISYNYRNFGDNISGIVRIWHSHGKMPEGINEFDKPWPPRKILNGRIIRPRKEKKFIKRALIKTHRIFSDIIMKRIKESRLMGGIH